LKDFGYSTNINLFSLQTEPFDDLLSYKGDLIIGLKFVPPDVTSAMQKKGKRSSRGSLNVLVKEAKNLIAVKANGTSDPFCKRYAYQQFAFLPNNKK
jgi:synaptotagmin-like protein